MCDTRVIYANDSITQLSLSQASARPTT
jgi:hypothetical protein